MQYDEGCTSIKKLVNQRKIVYFTYYQLLTDVVIDLDKLENVKIIGKYILVA